jgi:IS30 family transposase
MPKRFEQISKEDRDRIALLMARGKSFREIGRLIGRHHTTISREMNRNSTRWLSESEYLPTWAQQNADVRKTKAHQRERLRAPGLRSYVTRRIKLGWSPELIAGRWKKLGREPISYEAIYQWIRIDRRELLPFLVRAHPDRKKHKKRGGSRVQIPSRTGISERPAEVQLRQQAGHWEGDTIVSSKSRTTIQVLVERKSRFVRLKRLPARDASSVKTAIVGALVDYPRDLRRTITYDNGTENARHQEINQKLGTASYFCDPMQSWQKGSVEHVAGLVRRRLPKKTDFATVPVAEIKKTERWINNRPLKCLGFATPAEAFADEWCI